MSITQSLRRNAPRRAWEALARRDSFAQRVAMLAGSTLAAQGIALATAPLLTRLYRPDHFGLLAVLASLVAPLTVAVCARYDQAIPLPRSDAAAANVGALALSLAFLVAGLSAAGIALAGDRLARAFNADELAGYLWLVPVAVLSTGASGALTFWAMRRKAFSRVAGTRLNQVGLRVGLQALLGLLGVAPLGLLLGESLGPFGGSSTLAYAAWRDDRGALRRISARRMAWAARRYLRFPLIALPSAVLNILATVLPGFVLPMMFGTAQAGFFLVAQRLAGWPVNLLGNSVGQVFYTDLAARADDHRGNWRRFLKLTRHLGVIGLAGASVLATAPVWAGWVLGARWTEAGWVMAAMIPLLAGRLLVAPVSYVYCVRNRQGVLFLLDLLRLAAVAGTFALCWHAKAGLRLTVAMFSLVMGLLYVVHWIVIARTLADPAHATAQWLASECGAGSARRPSGASLRSPPATLPRATPSPPNGSLG